MRRTRVIAHRGASGYLPEHTAAAKALGYGLGADFLEQDVVATRDGCPVVLHDIYLDDVSDVAERFPGRMRADGRFYVIDFTAADLDQLVLTERRAPGAAQKLFPQRFPFALPSFRIVTLADEIRLIAGLNATTGREVGLYPEIKEPAWHQRHGVDLTRLVDEALKAQRAIITGPVFVQSFDRDALLRLRDELGSEWPRILLLSYEDAARLDAQAQALADIAQFASGVGLPFQCLIDLGSHGRLRASPLAERLAQSGLLVHPYTLRRDAPAVTGIGYTAALEFLIGELGVDAIFCDQPDDAIAIRDGSAA